MKVVVSGIEIDGTQEELEMFLEYLEGKSEVEEKEVPEITTGSIEKITDTDGNLHEKGEVVEVIEHDKDDDYIPYKVRSATTGRSSWLYNYQLEIPEASEIIEGRRYVLTEDAEDGDCVKGDIVKVETELSNDIYGDPYNVVIRGDEGMIDFARPGDLVLLTEEEIEETADTEETKYDYDVSNYREVDRKAEVGDLVEYVDGRKVVVTKVNSEGNLFGTWEFMTKEGDGDFMIYGVLSPHKVYEPIDKGAQVGDIVVITKYQYAANVGTVVEVKESFDNGTIEYSIGGSKEAWLSGMDSHEIVVRRDDRLDLR